MEVLDLQRPLLGQPQKAKATDERPSLPKAAPPGEGSFLPFTPPPHYFIPGSYSRCEWSDLAASIK